MAHDLILVGTGGQGGAWCAHFLPPNVEAGHVNVVAAADVDPDALDNAREHLGLADDRLYTDAAAAFAGHDADCCAIVTPPFVHEEVVDLAVEHDCDIISEKPIADTLEASVRIAEKVERAGLKMGVTMSHRFDRDKTTLRAALEDPDTGPVDYLVGRFTCALREYGAWGAFRHDMADPLMVEGAVHQLDFLADMAGEEVTRLYADTWLPEWGEYDGDCQALVQFRTADGTRVAWEGAKANATSLNCWGHDYVRAECRDATVTLDDREITRRPYADGEESEPVPLIEGDTWSNTWLIEQFAEWLDGDEPMATNVHDNLQSMALVEGAIASSRTGETVHVQELLAETRERVRAELD
ncbi:MAG: Gfo/Idh/MocA family protein [Halobacteriaceae archaeon]